MEHVEIRNYDASIGLTEDAVVGEGNKPEDDGERENNMARFDPVCFFSSPTFPQEDLDQALKRITNAFQDPLSRLEVGGVQKYLEYIRHRVGLKSKKEMNESERLRKVMQDATIKGDPRAYQRVLFEIAKSANTIINLGTGFGKTLIGIMCIRHFSSSFDEGKQTLFLVPSVALAIQQSITLRANLPKYDVRTACYTSTNSDSARESLSKCHVIVATHGAVSLNGAALNFHLCHSGHS
jgi:superfamily II DNA or RNA helicase